MHLILKHVPRKCHGTDKATLVVQKKKSTLTTTTVNMCCEMINAVLLKKSKYHYGLAVTVALLLLRLCCNFGSRYLKFIGVFFLLTRIE